MRPLSIFIALLFFNFRTAAAQAPPPGTLDGTFGNNGYASAGFNNGFMENLDIARKILVQSDGKIVVVGDSEYSIGIVRFTLNGAIDPTFGEGGKIMIPGGYIGAALQPDDKIIVGVGDQNLIRYTADGELDNSFFCTTNYSVYGPDCYSPLTEHCIAMQPDGKIVLAFFDSFSGDSLKVARYLADGNLDSSFGINGVAVPPVWFYTGTSAPPLVSLTHIKENGQIVVVANTKVVQLNTDGSVDTNYGNNGFLQTGLNVKCATIQNDGKLLVGGTVFTAGANGLYHASVKRYDQNGSHDQTFYYFSEGYVYQAEMPMALYEQADSSIWMTSIGDQFSYTKVSKLSAGGFLDGDYGFYYEYDNNLTSYVEAAALCIAEQADGKILVGGFGYDHDNPAYHEFVVCRYFSGTNINVDYGNDSIISEPLVFPNPGDVLVTLDYELPADGEVTIVVKDNSGQTLITCVNDVFQTGGHHQILIPVYGLNPGLYFVSITSPDGQWFVNFIKI